MSRELRRMKEIDRALAKAKSRYRKVSHTYAQVKAERTALEKSISALHEERDAIAQGQLMFPVEQPKRFTPE